MKIELRPVTADNFQECIGLELHEEQRGFCASNLYSIAEAYVEPLAIPVCIYAKGEMVGFALYGPENPENGLYMSIDRFMIDRKHQGKGYGKAALRELIHIISRKFDYDEIFISYNPENTVAHRLYTDLGFAQTGEFSGGECIAKLIVKHFAAND